jgi:Zn-dependent peptidase ImmA (M78 family)
MELPKQFRLKGKLWKVVLVKQLVHEDGTKCYGICDTDTRVIHIEKNLNPAERFNAFLHELCHAMIHEAHIDETLLDGKIEEILCEAFADIFTHDFDINLMEKFNE